MPSHENPYQPPKESVETPAPLESANVDDEAIYFAGSLTVNDAYEAVELAKTRFALVAARAKATILAILLLVVTLYAGYQFNNDEDFFIPLTGMVLIDVLVIVVAVAHPRSIRWRAEQLYHEGKGLYTRTQGKVDDTHIESQADGTKVKLTWDTFSGHRHSERIAVLYQHFPASYVIFARTKFRNDAEWQQFLKIVSEKLPLR